MAKWFPAGRQFFFLDRQWRRKKKKKKKKKKGFPLPREIRFLSYAHQSERKCTRAKTHGRLKGNRSCVGYLKMLNGMYYYIPPGCLYIVLMGHIHPIRTPRVNNAGGGGGGGGGTASRVIHVLMYIYSIPITSYHFYIQMSFSVCKKLEITITIGIRASSNNSC